MPNNKPCDTRNIFCQRAGQRLIYSLAIFCIAMVIASSGNPAYAQSTIKVTNQTSRTLNVALHWSNILQDFKNSLAPGATHTFNVGIGYHDFIAAVDDGDPRHRFTFETNGRPALEWGILIGGSAGVVVGAILVPVSGGTTAVVATGVAVAVVGAAGSIAGGALIATSAEVRPAQLTTLRADHSHHIYVKGGDVIATEQGTNSAGQKTYSIKASPLYVLSKNIKTGDILVESGKDGAKPVAAIGNNLYFVWQGKLWEKAPGGASRAISSGWGGTEAMTAMNGKLYAVHGGKLWEQEPNKPAKDLGGGWGGTESITTMNGKLYAVQGGTLWEKQPGQHSKNLGGGWAGTKVMTAMKGRLYAVQGGKLWEKQPGSSSREIAKNWGAATGLVMTRGPSLKQLFTPPGGQAFYGSIITEEITAIRGKEVLIVKTSADLDVKKY